MRLVVVICTMLHGGEARVASILTRYWAKKYDVTLIDFHLDEGPSFFPLHPSIKHYSIGQPGDLFHTRANPLNYALGLFRCIKQLRKILKEIDPEGSNLIISINSKISVIANFSAMFSKRKVIACEHVFPLFLNGYIWRFLRSIAFLFSNKIVTLTKSGSDYFAPLFTSKTVVIPNPIIAAPSLPIDPTPNLNFNFILGVGRFVEQKRFDILIRAFARAQMRDWRLVLVGEGPLESDLKSLAAQLNVEKQIIFIPITSDIYSIYRQAKIFAMASDYEGFPMALCEAMSAGLPCIHTRCPSGPEEIIQDRINGILVECRNVNALSNALLELMKNEKLRSSLAQKATQVTEIYSIEKINQQWETLFNQVVGVTRNLN